MTSASFKQQSVLLFEIRLHVESSTQCVVASFSFFDLTLSGGPLPTPRIPYDSFYKRIFSHPLMVYELIQLLSAKQLELDTLHLFATEHVSRDLQKRYQDLVYQATSMTNGGAVYLAFEFQSTVDKHMPLRMNSYCSLLLEQLVRTQPKGLDSAYPRIYPIVIYNGKRRWTAPLQLSEWFGRRSSMLSNYRGRCRINLVDLSTYKEWALQCEGSPLALLIRLEGAESVEELAEVAEEFTEWYQSSGVDTLKTDLTGLLKANAELVGGIELRNRLAGVQDMGRLAETMKEWIAEKEAAGIAQGLKQGLVQGKRDTLLRQVESKYGLQVREELTETLQQCTKPEALDRFADWILECDTAADLYQRMRSSSNGMNWLD